MQLLVFTLLTCFRLSTTEMKTDSEIPPSHAEILEKLIRDNIFHNTSIMEFYGNITDADNETLARLENLEFATLDRNSLKTIVELAKRNEVIQMSREARRAGPGGKKYLTAIYYNVHIRDKILDLMKQAIYATRYRMERTKDIRKRYHTEKDFNLGIMYGNIMELRSKAGHAFTTMLKLDIKKTKFFWYVILYERILAIHTDVSTSVRRLFALKGEGNSKEPKRKKKKASKW